MAVLTATQTLADEERILTTHYTPGRGGKRVTKILWHHNAGVLSIPQIYDVWQTREASAHYQVDVNGRIGQLVHDWDTAWHAGDWDANLTSIGIEHSNSGGAPDWPISDATLDAGAKLTASLCHTLALGTPTLDVNIFPHRRFQATQCPGNFFMRIIDDQISLARKYYNQMGAGSIPVTPETPAKPVAPTVPALPQPFPLPRDHYYGLVTGPERSHGGYYAAERPVVKIIQQRLIAKGYVPGVTDVNSPWADGLFEQPTLDAVARFQRAEMPGTQYYGQVWWDDYAQLAK